MKLFSLVSVVLLLCCVSPLLAEEKPDADHAAVTFDPLPAGWTGQDLGNGTYLAYSESGQTFNVYSSYHSKDFPSFCKTLIERENGGLGLKGMKITDPHPATVGPPGTLEYDITGKETDTDTHTHCYLMAVRKTYAMATCRCDAGDWEKMKPVFEGMVKNAK